MKLYVDINAGRDGNGSHEMPFRHIQDAAAIAQPGDEVLVAPGIYREYVDPTNAGKPHHLSQYAAAWSRDHRCRGGKGLEKI